MPATGTGRPARLFSWCKRIVLATLLVSLPGPALRAADPDIFPLSQIQPGMKGEGYTIFAGDQIEKFDLVVIGVMPNFLAPKESIILAQLVGAKVEHTGVVAGMSGSPVYIDGKLAGALSLKLGQFSKEPLAGITPIENILSLPKGPAGTMRAEASPFSAGELSSQMDARLEIPSDWASRAGISSGSFLTPIDSPLVFSGFSAVAIRQFEKEFAPYGMAAAQGGSIDARPDDANIRPGDMVSAVLLEGDLSLNASCTVTAIVDGRVWPAKAEAHWLVTEVQETWIEKWLGTSEKATSGYFGCTSATCASALQSWNARHGIVSWSSSGSVRNPFPNWRRWNG